MIELVTVASLAAYVIYLRYYADPRSEADKQVEQLKEGIELFRTDRLAAALAYFNEALKKQPKLALAYLYRARIYRLLGDTDAAMADLRTGKSFDDTMADLHLDAGQIQLEKPDLEAAFQDFDKAVFYGNQPEAYHWRGVVRKKMGQVAEAEQDMARGEALVLAAHDLLGTLPAQPTGFLSRLFLLHAFGTLLSTVALLVAIKTSPVIHWPYMLAAASAGLIGFTEPRKGWSLALGQAVLLWVGYQFIIGPAASGVVRQVESFGLYGAIGLTFAGSFLGSIVKRAQA